MASSEVLGAGANLRLDPGCHSAPVLVPLAALSRSFPTRDVISASCRAYVPLLALKETCWWRRMLFSCFLIKNEQDHINRGFSSGGNQESRGLENMSLCTAGSRQCCFYMTRTGRQQKHWWLSQQLVVNLTCVPMFLSGQITYWVAWHRGEGLGFSS